MELRKQSLPSIGQDDGYMGNANIQICTELERLVPEVPLGVTKAMTHLFDLAGGKKASGNVGIFAMQSTFEEVEYLCQCLATEFKDSCLDSSELREKRGDFYDSLTSVKLAGNQEANIFWSTGFFNINGQPINTLIVYGIPRQDLVAPFLDNLNRFVKHNNSLSDSELTQLSIFTSFKEDQDKFEACRSHLNAKRSANPFELKAMEHWQADAGYTRKLQETPAFDAGTMKILKKLDKVHTGLSQTRLAAEKKKVSRQTDDLKKQLHEKDKVFRDKAKKDQDKIDELRGQLDTAYDELAALNQSDPSPNKRPRTSATPADAPMDVAPPANIDDAAGGPPQGASQSGAQDPQPGPSGLQSNVGQQTGITSAVNDSSSDSDAGEAQDDSDGDDSDGDDDDDDQDEDARGLVVIPDVVPAPDYYRLPDDSYILTSEESVIGADLLDTNEMMKGIKDYLQGDFTMADSQTYIKFDHKWLDDKKLRKATRMQKDLEEEKLLGLSYVREWRRSSPATQDQMGNYKVHKTITVVALATLGKQYYYVNIVNGEVPLFLKEVLTKKNRYFVGTGTRDFRRLMKLNGVNMGRSSLVELTDFCLTVHCTPETEELFRRRRVQRGRGNRTFARILLLQNLNLDMAHISAIRRQKIACKTSATNPRIWSSNLEVAMLLKQVDTTKDAIAFDARAAIFSAAFAFLEGEMQYRIVNPGGTIILKFATSFVSKLAAFTDIMVGMDNRARSYIPLERKYITTMEPADFHGNYGEGTWIEAIDTCINMPIPQGYKYMLEKRGNNVPMMVFVEYCARLVYKLAGSDTLLVSLRMIRYLCSDFAPVHKWSYNLARTAAVRICKELHVDPVTRNHGYKRVIIPHYLKGHYFLAVLRYLPENQLKITFYDPNADEFEDLLKMQYGYLSSVFRKITAGLEVLPFDENAPQNCEEGSYLLRAESGPFTMLNLNHFIYEEDSDPPRLADLNMTVTDLRQVLVRQLTDRDTTKITGPN